MPVLYLLFHLLPDLEYALHVPGWLIGALIIITFSAAHFVLWFWYRRTYRRLGVDPARVRAFEHQQTTWFKRLHRSFKYLPIVAVCAAAVALRFARVYPGELWVVLAVVFRPAVVAVRGPTPDQGDSFTGAKPFGMMQAGRFESHIHGGSGINDRRSGTGLCVIIRQHSGAGRFGTCGGSST